MKLNHLKMSHLNDSDCEIIRKSKRKTKKIASSDSEICIRTRRKTRFQKDQQKSSYVPLSRIIIQFHENLTIFFFSFFFQGTNFIFVVRRYSSFLTKKSSWRVFLKQQFQHFQSKNSQQVGRFQQVEPAFSNRQH